MGCSKFVSFFISIYGLAFLIAINEARPADENTLQGEITPKQIAEIVNDLNDKQIGDITKKLPADVVGQFFEKLTTSDISRLFQEVPLDERKAADTYIPMEDIKNFLKALPKDEVKKTFGHKASTLLKLSDSKLIDVIEHANLHELARQYLKLPAVDAGDNIQGFKSERVGRFVHGIPEDELEAIIQSVLNDAFSNLPEVFGAVKDALKALPKEALAQFLKGLSNGFLGKLAKSVPKSLFGKFIQNLSTDELAILLGGLPGSVVADTLKQLGDAKLKEIVNNLSKTQLEDIFGCDAAPNVQNLSSEALLEEIQNLNGVQRARFIKDDTPSVVGEAIGDFPASGIGELFHALSEYELEGALTDSLVSAVIDNLSTDELNSL